MQASLLFFLFVLTALTVFPSAAESPRLPNPVFQSLSTKNGLPQDVVNDILIDPHGFVWIATDGGVVRWDGVRTLEIKGPDDIFVNATINKLALEEGRALWISTYSSGVYRLDLETQHVTQTISRPYHNITEWKQNAESFFTLNEDEVVVALPEEVIRYTVSSNHIDVLYSLEPQLVEQGHIIRHATVVDNVLIVATTNGVRALDLSNPDGAVVKINYLKEIVENEDNTNTKWLMLDDANRFWIGTVKGLYMSPKSALLRQVRQGAASAFAQILSSTNVWTMEPSQEDAFWLGSNKGLYELSLGRDGWKAEHIFVPHNGRTELSNKKISAIVTDNIGNLWLSSVYGGALYFSVRSADIFAIQGNDKRGEPLLSDNMVWSLSQTDNDGLWIGTENGLNLYDFSRGEVQSYLVTEEDGIEGEAMIERIVPTNDNRLFIQTYEGIRIFDPKSGVASMPPISGSENPDIFNNWLPGIASDDAGLLYFADGHEFYRYDLTAQTVSVLPLDPAVFDTHYFVSFLGQSDYHGGRMFMAMEGGLWLVDLATFEHEMVFRFTEKQRAVGRSISSWVIDDFGVLWLGFNGYGLFGLDADTFEPIYKLNEDNLLLSNIVYGLRKDDKGNLWFSSHSGLHKYSPSTSSVQNFVYGRELSVSEFNEGAAHTLQDGRLAFGSTTGVIVFSPEKISESITRAGLLSKQMVITHVSIDSRNLALPLTNLNGKSIALEHTDYGLSIHFSAMTMSKIGKLKYHYKLLKNGQVVSEGITEDEKITLANLDAGEYQFSVGPTPGSFEYTVLPAEISIKMPYAPWLSPYAYAAYITLIGLLFFSYLMSRQRQLFRLQNAQKQVALFSDAFRQTRDWVIIFDKNKVPVAANPAFETVFGFNARESLAKQLQRLVGRYPLLQKQLLGSLTQLKGGEFWKDEGEIVGADGKHYDVLIDITAISDDEGNPDHYLLVISDITEQKNAERKLLKIANYDSLTGLVNRSLLLDRLEHAIGHARVHNHRVAVMFVDLDRFKGINDSLGHDYGDKLLRVVANRMRNLVSDLGTVARLGGDEFVIVVEEVSLSEDLSSFVGQLIESVETPISLASEVLRVSCSVGVAFYPDDASEPAELIKQSDVAMYTAKKDTLNGFTYFTEDMNDRARQRLHVENLVKRAYSEKCFFNHYQPIIDARNKRTVGVELLLRGELDNAPIYPDTFIPILEQLRYIIDVSRQAMRRAAQDLSNWYKEGFTGYVSINLSALHFKTEFDLAGVLALLDEFHLPKTAFRFEITEGVLMDDSDNAYRQISRFVEKGFVLALDDFGTGYSSLSYLKRYPLSVLKIDKSFVNEMAPGNANDALVSTTITLASSLNMQSIAEGVETESQAECLLSKGCIYHQGYHYAKPMRAKDLTPYLFRQW